MSADAAEVRTTQYFEMFGCRAIYHEGWKAVTYVSMMDGDIASDDDPWELYDVVADPSECHDLARPTSPSGWPTMVERWWAEAEAHGVLPIDSQPFFEAHGAAEADTVAGPVRVLPRHRAGGGAGGGRTCAAATTPITATVDIADGGADGVLISQGSGLGGLRAVRGRRPAARTPTTSSASRPRRSSSASARCRRPAHRRHAIRQGRTTGRPRAR